MAYDDVYKLVQQQLAQGQGKGRNQFYDPTVDFALKIPEIIQNEKDTRLVQDKSTLTDFEKLIQSANTDSALSNVENTINNFNVSDDTLNPQYQAMQNLISQKKSSFKRGKNALSEVENNLGVYEDFTIDEIKSWDIERLKNEIIRVADVKDGLAISGRSGFQHENSKISLERAGRSIVDYESKLKNTMQALATQGMITDEEAEAIFFGDFKEVKADIIKNSQSQIDNANKNIKSWSNKIAKASGDDAWMAQAFQDGAIEGKQTVDDAVAQYTRWINSATQDRDYYTNRYNTWSRSPYATPEDIKKAAFGKLDDGSGGVVSPKKESVETGQNVEAGAYDESGALVKGEDPSEPSKTTEPKKVTKLTGFEEKEITKEQEPTYNNLLQKAFDESNYNIEKGTVKKDIYKKIKDEEWRLRGMSKNHPEYKRRTRDVAKLKQIALSMKQYGTYLKQLKRLTNKGKPVPSSLRDKINQATSRAQESLRGMEHQDVLKIMGDSE